MRQDARIRWQALEANGDVWDYGDKTYLISQCRKHRVAYNVVRTHRDGRTSVLEYWRPNTEVKCTCGMPWEEDMGQFGCWSCGALTHNVKVRG